MHWKDNVTYMGCRGSLRCTCQGPQQVPHEQLQPVPSSIMSSDAPSLSEVMACRRQPHCRPPCRSRSSLRNQSQNMASPTPLCHDNLDRLEQFVRVLQSLFGRVSLCLLAFWRARCYVVGACQHRKPGAARSAPTKDQGQPCSKNAGASNAGCKHAL